MDIQNEYVISLQRELEKYKEEHKNDVLRASSTGACMLQVINYYNKVEEKKERSPKELITLQIGNIIHRDIQKHLEHKNNLLFEVPISIPELNVTGHIDILELENNKITIYDIKTIGKYSYQKKFGLKRNRDSNPSERHYMQVGTYAIAIKKLFPDIPIEAFLIYIRKDDGFFKPVKVNIELYMQKAFDYWDTVNHYIKIKYKLEKGMMYCPVEFWECRYCPFEYLCREENNENKM